VFEGVLGGRLNTPTQYLSINRELAGPRVVDGSFCKKSVVGKAVVESGCKIVDSVVMDNVVLESGVKLEGCVIGKGARIGKGSHLIACDVGNGVNVQTQNAQGECFDD
jgi:translation initiation factor eIF-2B subunit gamma